MTSVQEEIRERIGVALRFGPDAPVLVLVDPEDGVPWWFGLRADHLFEDCPARRRSLPRMREWGGPDGQGRGLVDPLGTDICGWCQRVWRARNPAARGDGSGSPAIQDPNSTQREIK